MTSLPRVRRLALCLALAISAPAPAGEVTVEDLARRLQAIEQRLGTAPAQEAAGTGLADLDQRLRVIERKLELQAEEAAGEGGQHAGRHPQRQQGPVGQVAATGRLEVKFNGLVQADGRFYFDDDQQPAERQLPVAPRRTHARRHLGRADRLPRQAQLAGDSATINDAYLDLRFDPRATVRMGKFKEPFGLERLQSSSALSHDRTRPAHRTGAGTRLSACSCRANSPAARSATRSACSMARSMAATAPRTNPDNDFEAGRARVLASRGRTTANALVGPGLRPRRQRRRQGRRGNNFLPRYRTPGQVQFFNYRSDVAADGEHTPLVAAGLLLPQARSACWASTSAPSRKCAGRRRPAASKRSGQHAPGSSAAARC